MKFPRLTRLREVYKELYRSMMFTFDGYADRFLDWLIEKNLHFQWFYLLACLIQMSLFFYATVFGLALEQALSVICLCICTWSWYLFRKKAVKLLAKKNDTLTPLT